MNVSFFALILVLVALAFLTSWNGHVLLLLGLTSALWAAMVWYGSHPKMFPLPVQAVYLALI